MRIGTVVAAWLLPATLLAGGAADARRGREPIEVTDDDDGRVFRVPVGTEFSVRLPQEVGEDWQWEMRDDPRFIAVDPPYRQGYGRERGDREDRIFTVRVTQPGRFPLVFEKWSTFGGWKRSPARRVGYLVEATGDRVEDGRLDGDRVDAAPRGPVQTLRERDADRVTRVPADGEIVILLPFASRLEQRWEVIGSRNIGLAAPIAEERDPTRGRNIFWLDSNSVIRLRPGGRGKAEVTLSYLPRSPGSSAARQLRYRFVVD